MSPTDLMGRNLFSVESDRIERIGGTRPCLGDNVLEHRMTSPYSLWTHSPDILVVFVSHRCRKSVFSRNISVNSHDNGYKNEEIKVSERRKISFLREVYRMFLPCCFFPDLD